MKVKYILCLFICFFILLIKVDANEIYSIDIKAKLDKEGTMHVEEIWKVNAIEGTELYKEELNLNQMKIVNFKVKDNVKNYTMDEIWEVEGSFNDKKYKYGINYTTNGIELCWGISRYGKNTYTISYDIKNVIFNVNDAQVLEKRLVNSLNSGVDKFSIEITGPYKYPDSLDVWCYGSKSYCYVDDGKIRAASTEDSSLSREEYSAVLVKFPLNTFEIDYDIRHEGMNTFDDVLKDAENGSFEYDYSVPLWDRITAVISVIVSVLPVVAVIIFALTYSKYKFGPLGKKIKMKEINMFRDIPCDKDIYKAYFLAKVYNLSNKDTDFLGAILLKWLDEDKVSVIKVSEKITNIQLKDNISFDIECEKKLYDYIYEASVDGVLEAKEFEKYITKHYSKIDKWFTKVEEYGRDKYVSLNLVSKSGHKYLIDDKLKSEAINLAGLKKYLKEFSLIEEKQPIEVKLWKDYLIFAQIFGMADSVAKAFEKLYPEVIVEMEHYNYSIGDIYLLNSMSRNIIGSLDRQRAQNYSSGGGGFSSGGGGGSFGGGGGGGFR